MRESTEISLSNKDVFAKNTRRMDTTSLSAIFRDAVQQYPDVVAVEHGEEHLTYQALDRLSDVGAQVLQMRGVGPDVLVGICLERSFDMVVAVLSVIKAGGAYVPLDPHYPQDRLALLLGEANLSFLITTPDITLPTTVKNMLTPTDLSRAEGELSPVTLSPENLAYVLYTSGSTGVPKGVAMCARPLLNLIPWQCDESKALPVGAKTLQFASLSFDVSFQEIFTTLGSGGTLVLLDEKTRRDFSALLPFIIENKIARLFLPFVALSNLCEVARVSNTWPVSLREVITAGEQLQITPSVRQFFTQCENTILVNQYGPSETHVVTAHTLIGDPKDWPALPPIGKPLPYVITEVTDAGELLLGGDCLARGYLGQMERTQEKFITLPEGRFYKTGDQVELNAGGEWQFLGRLDTQVKIRGYRVELGEIEARLTQIDGVAQAVVCVESSTHGDKLLVAYLQLASMANIPTGAQIRQFLGSTLPDYMVPTAFATLEEFPLTPSGKVDRKAVALLEGTRLPTNIVGGTVFESYQNTEEKAVGRAWESVLGISPIGTSDNFFDLGGHSLQLVHLQEAMQALFQREIPITTFFQYPTIRTFTRHLKEKENKTAENTPKSAGISAQAERAARQRAAMNQARRAK
jgi:amino acid adenylation domain-containing protein